MIETLDIAFERAGHSRITEFDENNIQFGKVYSDHMFMAHFKKGYWKDMVIKPFGNLSISPANTTLHYGQSVFEGLKANRAKNGDILVFRPEANARRMIKSAERMCIPPVSEEMFMATMTELLRIDRDWVPSKPGTSLYIRPVCFGMDPYIGIRPSEEYAFMIFTSPVGAYYTEPVTVKIETHFTRAAAGGVGAAKTAGNYAAALYPATLAQKEGYNQLIWTDGVHHEYIEESGTMNVAFLIDGTLITAPTGDTILNGITRDSILTLAREWGIEVEERKLSIKDLMIAINSGNLNEAFGIGTAATIAPIKSIGYEGADYNLPSVDSWELAPKLLKTLDDIKTGKVEDVHGWVYRI
ncbi:MAG: branched-chain amino acid aminotransferase [Bacteroidetes bacterium]|nr:branched-chain amino acid aminotransferase [Bacteroidota bacterium]MDA1119643.1 branched-chain amino acid aminotransferase [Bacteroidota bacterium]